MHTFSAAWEKVWEIEQRMKLFQQFNIFTPVLWRSVLSITIDNWTLIIAFRNGLFGSVNISKTGSIEREYFVKDHLGSVRVTLSDKISTPDKIKIARDYYPYGDHINNSYIQSSEPGRYQFTEKERDAETNLDYFGARYYNSSLGMWLSVDPLAEW